MRTSSRYALMAATTLAMSTALLAGTAAVATAAPVKHPQTSASAMTSQQVRTAAIEQYGVYPLPVSERDIAKYDLSKKQIKDIASAKKLAKGKEASKIRQRESHGSYGINTGNGYYGAYQLDRGTWKSNGGAQFSKTANKAPKWAQDYVMYRTQKARGWSPWTTA